MHIWFGYTIGEWVGIVSLIASVSAGIGYLVNLFIFKPLTDAIDKLTEGIDDFKVSTKEEHERFRADIEDHEKRIIKLEVKEDK